MATLELVLHQTLFSKPVDMRFYYNDLTISPGTAGVALDLASAFEDFILPLILAVQASQCVTDSIYCRDLGNPGGAVSIANDDPGALTVADNLVLPSDLPIFFRASIGQWYDLDTNTAYNGERPGGSGRKFFPGLTEEWLVGSGAAIPAALLTAWGDLEEALVNPIDTTSPTASWNYCVFTPEKSAGSGLPARNALKANVVALTVRRGTRLLSRRP